MMLSLVIAALQSILQVMVVVFFGFMLSRFGYFTADKQKWLSKLNVGFFTPCLLFSNIASIISLEKLLAYWPIPVFYLTFFLISIGLGHLISRLLGLDHNYRRFVLACALFSNTNSLPIAVISSLAVLDAGKILYWDADDTQAAVAARGISYALFYAIFSNILRWSYGYNLLQGEDMPDSNNNTVVVDYTRPHYGGTDNDSDDNRDIEQGYEDNDNERRASLRTLAEQHHNHPPQKGQVVNETSGLLSSFPSLPSDLDEDGQSDGSESSSSSTRLWLQRLPGYATVSAWAKWIHQYMTPPLYAAMLAIFVGLIPPLKDLLYDKDSFLYPSFTSAIQSCGRAAVPIILVCLGAQLTEISQSSGQSLGSSKKPVAAVIIIRMCLAPVFVIPIVTLFVQYASDWATIAADPVFNVMMIILGCTPTAINLVQISQVTGAFEDEMLQVLFWSYGVVCIPVFTLVVFLALNVIDKLL